MPLPDTMRLEAEAILQAVSPLSTTYTEALKLIASRSPVIWSGMGKSGYVAQKAASTLRSVGVPSYYVHPADASHGDLGAVQGLSVAVILSNSGETPELTDLIFFCRENEVPMVAITGRGDSTLAKESNVVLCYGSVREACPNGLAPTTSTTVALALCDAMAVDLSRKRGVTPAEFHRYHPGGKLGHSLRRAKDLMQGPVPAVPVCAPIGEAAIAMTGRVPGICLVTGPHGMEGILTDGDLRRYGARAFTEGMRAGDVMTGNPLVVGEYARGSDLARMMNERRVTKLLVEDALGSIVGVVNIHDVGG